jgi:hypothetical protein
MDGAYLSNELEDGEVSVAALTRQEQTFAMMLVDTNGNLREAYAAAFPGHDMPMARAQQLVARPEILQYVSEISKAIGEHHNMTLAGHLCEVACIRDLAKATGQLGVALKAEMYRGTASKIVVPEEKSPGSMSVTIKYSNPNFNRPVDVEARLVS